MTSQINLPSIAWHRIGSHCIGIPSSAREKGCVLKANINTEFVAKGAAHLGKTSCKIPICILGSVLFSLKTVPRVSNGRAIPEVTEGPYMMWLFWRLTCASQTTRGETSGESRFDSPGIIGPFIRASVHGCQCETQCTSRLACSF